MWLNKSKTTSILLALTVVFSVSTDAKEHPTKNISPSKSEQSALNKPWLKLRVQKVNFLKKMFMPGVEHLFVKNGSQTFVPPIQHFRRKIRSNFQADFKRITREILANTAEGGRLPAYVSTVSERKDPVKIDGKEFESQYLEYTFKGKQSTYVGCFKAVQSGGYIHTFFTQAFADSFTDCQKEMDAVVQQI